MRTHGTLTRWNDDRGFGFITPAKESADVFVHISEYPRDGVRPRLKELISFEVEAGPDGKQRAVRIMRPGQGAASRAAALRQQKPTLQQRAGSVLTLLAIAGLGAYFYSRHSKQDSAAEVPGRAIPVQLASPTSPYACDGRTMCSQMTSCAEATHFIRHCPDTQMDGDNDGVPCESQWCK